MLTLHLYPSGRIPQAPRIQIEPATACDGSLCHQPIFREDGELNRVLPHSHMIEWGPEGARYYAIFCDVPHGEDGFESFSCFPGELDCGQE
jgi:hypothetical protein